MVLNMKNRKRKNPWTVRLAEYLLRITDSYGYLIYRVDEPTGIVACGNIDSNQVECIHDNVIVFRRSEEDTEKS